MWQFVRPRLHLPCTVKCQEMIKHEGALVHVNTALSDVNYSRLWRHHGKNNTQDDCIPLWLQLDVFVLVFSTHRGMGVGECWFLVNF